LNHFNLILIFNIELLRKTSEHVLIDMVQLLFARLPQFKDDTTSPKRVKDFSTKNITTNNHRQRVHSETLINKQQTNRKNYSILSNSCFF